MNGILGAAIQPCDNCEEIIADLSRANGDYNYMLAYCYDGVCWGNCQNGNWNLGHDAFPMADFCPKPTKQNLMEMRIFGLKQEILIWRVDGGFKGRILTDNDKLLDNKPIPDHLKPLPEERLLLGTDVLEVKKDFSWVMGRTGSQQIVPIAISSGPNSVINSMGTRKMILELRHYFQADPNTGALRIAASRLINVKEV